MNKKTVLYLLSAAILCIAGCGSKETKTFVLSGNTSGVAEVLAQGMAAADAEPSLTPTFEPVVLTVSTPVPRVPNIYFYEKNEDLDVDLTSMSPTMVYAEVFNMITAPQDYVGKLVRMHGEYTYYHDKKQDKYYYACLIRDATACCAQGLEFILNDDYTYPVDYPIKGAEVTITGTFNLYEENGHTFFHLADAVWEK